MAQIKTFLWLAADILSPETREVVAQAGTVLSPENMQWLATEYGVDYLDGRVILCDHLDKAEMIADAVASQER